MIKPVIFLFILVFLIPRENVFSQTRALDSLKNELYRSGSQMEQFNTLRAISNEFMWSYPDSTVPYIEQMILYARLNNSDEMLTKAYASSGWYYILTGDYPRALHVFQESLKTAERWGDIPSQANAYALMEYVYEDWGDYEKALTSVKSAYHLLMAHWRLTVNTSNSDTLNVYLGIILRMGSCHEKLNQLDSAQYYIKLTDSLFKVFRGRGSSAANYELGNIYTKRNNYEAAIRYYHNGITLAGDLDYKKDLIDIYNGLANIYKFKGEYDSSIYYANQSLEVSKSARHIFGQLNALRLLSDIYKLNHNNDSLALYLQQTLLTQDSLFSQNKIRQIQSLTLNEQIRLRDQEEREKQIREKVRFYALLLGLLFFLVIATILFRNNRQKQKAFNELQKQKAETDFQKSKAENALKELKSTQNQLIHSAKMASLGEVTAGIAHEIQNPLNFVNNFSEINKELTEEIRQEILKGNPSNAMDNLGNLEQNLEKIASHGKRADAIVKSMLQHSLTSTGQKEPTDINSLCDEYLRLAYHAMRRKDHSFHAEMFTELDNEIKKINIIPQDFGRVMLNLYNNAFHAVREKTRLNGSDYKPQVLVRTRGYSSETSGKPIIEIIIKDNGTGIPEAIKEKIFQPFFTTKPTGEGTGLGLSLSYDIVKAHGGEIRVESQEGRGSAFILSLPIV